MVNLCWDLVGGVDWARPGTPAATLYQRAFPGGMVLQVAHHPDEHRPDCYVAALLADRGDGRLVCVERHRLTAKGVEKLYVDLDKLARSTRVGRGDG